MEWWHLALAGGTLLLTVAGVASRVTKTVTQALAKHEQILVNVMAAHELEDVKRFASVKADIIASGEQVRDEMKETFQAMRQRVSDVELWGRDNYVQQHIFKDAIETFTNLLRGQRGRH